MGDQTRHSFASEAEIVTDPIERARIEGEMVSGSSEQWWIWWNTTCILRDHSSFVRRTC
jgi:hypothetical protein